VFFLLYILRAAAVLYSQKIETNQLAAQDFHLFEVRSPTCFGQIYWQSSGSRLQRCFNFTQLQLLLCFNLELSHTITTVVVFQLRVFSHNYNCCCVST